ncbi:MAG: amino acid dehydrogenase [Legionellales bacterium]|nr:amino acid dehydrogenase [Legionellales bacterium]
MTNPLSGSEDIPIDFLQYAQTKGHENIYYKLDSTTGLVAIIAIHSTRLGPALGGCRYTEYSSNRAAIYDALRLSRSMTSKAALAQLPHGGGKSVIIKSRTPQDRQALFESFGRFVNELNGKYITAVDSGTTLEDMEAIGHQTRYVASLPSQGEPSPFAALGVFRGIEAAVQFKLQRDSLTDVHVAVQGIGKVGHVLVQSLLEAGAKVSISDINGQFIEQYRTQWPVTVVPHNQIYQLECDVFAPCALGNVLNTKTIPQLNCQIVAGAANNQLGHDSDGLLLHQRNILYAPDYVINAGGLMYASGRYFNKPDAQITQKTRAIYEVLLEIFDRAQQQDAPTNFIANQLANEKIAQQS